MTGELGTRYGSWPSPITAASIVQGAATITEVVVDGDDIWWAETRPSEGGRTAILRRSAAGTVTEVTPAGANVRTLVHEYGGGAWWVAGGVLVYAERSDQQLRRVDPDGTVAVITADPTSRYADGRITPDGRWYVCVREQHGRGPEPANEIVAVPLDGSAAGHDGVVAVLVSGPDFVAAPRISPDGSRLAWIQWLHPDMPWDCTELWTAEFAGARLRGARRVTGDGDESLLQPEWSTEGDLYVRSDRDGWWNLYRAESADCAGTPLVPVRTGGFDVGGAMWVFGESAYALCSDGRVVVDQDVFGTVPSPTCIRARGDHVVVAGASWSSETSVLDIAPSGDIQVVRAPRDLGLDPGFFPPPESITFPTSDGAVAYAFFYRPANPSVPGGGEAGERPPLIVLAHGGPTGAARRSLHLPMRFWTSRGFAVVDVNYRGSVGYGRAYRRALDGSWGVADVDDVVAAARFLAERGDVDGDRLLIRGGSAGGFTVLCALTFHDVFRAGAVQYGIGDLEALLRDTHKFESRYLHRLVGPYPETRDVYEARSPIHHTDQLGVPMIVLHGSDDPVVPPSQAEQLVAALDRKGLPHAYVVFPGEGHGFRKAESIVRALEVELSFYAQLLDFTPADQIEPVALRNFR